MSLDLILMYNYYSAVTYIFKPLVSCIWAHISANYGKLIQDS
jgi:hypothetical protein